MQFPYPNASIEVATGEQPRFRTPGDRRDWMRMRERLKERVTAQVPEMDLANIFPTHGKQASIQGKGHTRDTACLRVRPEQSAVLYVPQLDRVIPAPSDQLASIRAEGEGSYPVRMGLPDAGQGLASLFPEPHFPTPAGCGPILSIGTDGDR